MVLQAARSFRRRHFAKIQPSRLRQIAVAKTEPSDENNQDISSLVGKVDIRKLETFAQNDPDAYTYSGGLNRANQGILEFVEMFKAPIKMLHPLLTSTQESNYIGTENIGAIPFTGVVLAHSNEAEWQGFKANKNNEAFIDRICVIKVPYCLRVTEEQKIYEKLISGSELATAPCAPATLETLARFSVMSRLRKHENSTVFAKMRVNDGESMRNPIRKPAAFRNTRMPPASTKAWTVLRPVLRSRFWPQRSIMIPQSWVRIKCTAAAINLANGLTASRFLVRPSNVIPALCQAKLPQGQCDGYDRIK
jgi:predicted Ser/Thr protein kinase